MKILLLYFSGSYNTLYLTTLLKNSFLKKNYSVDTLFLNDKSKINNLNSYDLVGIGYPIYFNNAPKFFLENIERLNIKNKKIFIYKNGGNYKIKDANYSSYQLINKISKNNEFLNEYHFIMPFNINTKLTDENCKTLIDYNLKYIDYITSNILLKGNNIFTFKGKCNSFFGKVKYNYYLLFSRNIKINKDICIKCRKCCFNCPMENIKYDKVKKKNYTINKCVLCLRCLNNCKVKALKKGIANTIAINERYNYFNINNLNSNKTISLFNDYYKRIDSLISNH